MSIYSPYTYLIGWTKYNKWYYGVRFAKDCSPNELWKSYFTSSKHVKKFRETSGEPDIIEVRKIFERVSQAQEWENKVLRRLKVVSKEKWLNKTDNKSVCPEASLRGARKKKAHYIQKNRLGYKHSEETKRKISESRTGSVGYWKGKCLPEETKHKLSNHGKTLIGKKNPFYGKSHSEETKRKIAESQRRRIEAKRLKSLNIIKEHEFREEG